MADMERTHMSALQSAQAAAAEADQRLADHVARSAKQRHMYTEFLPAMVRDTHTHTHTHTHT